MKIIGEKINGTRKGVAKAIAERDVTVIQSLARKQVDAGSQWLDVNAGTPPEQEAEDLAWLIQTIQSAVDVPLCLDSANPSALRSAMSQVSAIPMINSISGEIDRLAGILPIVVEFGCPVIALCMSGKGIPGSVQGRMEVLHAVMAETRRAGVQDDRVYVDPLVMTIATNTSSAHITLETMRAVRAEFPAVHICTGLSNISFGLPARSLINRTFIVLASEAGMDTAIIDPTDWELQATLLATDLLLARDKHCLNYTRAYRTGVLEPKLQSA